MNIFKKLPINLQITTAFSVVLVLSVVTILPITISNFKTTIATAEQRELKGVFENVKATIQMESRSAEMMSNLVANIPDVQQAMAEGDRERLMALLGNSFKVLKKEYGVRQFQFHTPPAMSFLRVNKPAKFGDDLSSFRKTVVETNTNKKVVGGIEKGVAGLGVRGMVPLFFDNNHLGSVEFGMSFGKPFFENFKALYGVDLALHVKREDGFKVFASTLSNQSLLSSEQLTQVINGEPIQFEGANEDKPVAVYAGTITDFSGIPIGVLEIAMDRSEYVAALNESIIFNSIIGFAFIVAGIIVAILLSRAIVRPVKETVTALNDVAEGDGDLTRRLSTQGSRDIAELAEAFNLFSEKVHGLVTDVAGSTVQLTSAAKEMSHITTDANQSIARQRSEIDQVATAMNEMTATVQEVARSAEEAANSAKEADEEASRGSRVVSEATVAINSLAQEVERAADVINNLQEKSQSIGSVLDVIRGIAEQTNLLALNAAIEAARAGDQGRGFAVVADEVRTLASRTQTSTREIEEMIDQLQTGASNAVSVMEAGKSRALESVNQAEVAAASLKTITEAVTRIHDMNSQIASAATEQSSVSEEINRNVVNINDVADQVTQSATQTANAGSNLAQLAEELQAMVGRFKT